MYISMLHCSWIHCPDTQKSLVSPPTVEAGGCPVVLGCRRSPCPLPWQPVFMPRSSQRRSQAESGFSKTSWGMESLAHKEGWEELELFGPAKKWRLWEFSADTCLSAKGRGYDHRGREYSYAGLCCHTGQTKWHRESRKAASNRFISFTVIAKGLIRLPTCIYPA